MSGENSFFVDGHHLSEAALARKHQLENNPAMRKNPLEYLPGMEEIEPDIRSKVMGHVDSYQPEQYTAADVRRALNKNRPDEEDLKALL